MLFKLGKVHEKFGKVILRDTLPSINNSYLEFYVLLLCLGSLHSVFNDLDQVFLEWIFKTLRVLPHKRRLLYKRSFLHHSHGSATTDHLLFSTLSHSDAITSASIILSTLRSSDLFIYHKALSAGFLHYFFHLFFVLDWRDLLGVKETRFNLDRAVRRGEFECIWDEIQEDLQVAVIVAQDLNEVACAFLVENIVELDAFLLGLEIESF